MKWVENQQLSIYQEKRPNELESTYAKTTGIIASDKEVFSDGWSTN